MQALQHITFTGIDAKTDIKALQEIQREYPLVEFGVLTAKNWSENGNRYPDPDTLSRLANKGLNLSCHVCGSYARAITQDIEWSHLFDLLGENKDIFNRCQINIAANEPTKNTFFLKTPRYFKEIIIQQKSVDEHKTWDAINYHGFMSILLDASGGLGIDTGIKLWPDWFYKVGYAGGMNADNVGDKLAYLIENARHPFWIDMESGVRTDDWFDIDKVLKVLKVCDEVLAFYTPEQLHRI